MTKQLIGLFRDETDEEVLEAILAAKNRIAKHGGPGPHKSGTPQSVHGRGGGRLSVPTLDLPAELQAKVSTDPRSIEVAQSLFDRALAIERETSPLLQALARRTRGRLVGFEHRLKQPASIVSKLFRTMDEEGLTIEEASDQIHDLVRYTVTWDTAEWADGYARTMDALRTEGWGVWDHKEKNFWTPGDHYDGMNVQLHKNGRFIEVQFHTTESVKIKERSHALWSSIRDLPPGDPRRGPVIEKIHGLWNASSSHRPVGFESFGFPATMFIQKAILGPASGFRFYVKSIAEEFTPTVLYRIEGTDVHRWSGGQWVLSALTPPELQGLGGSTDYFEISDRQALEFMGEGSPFAKRMLEHRFETTVRVAKSNKRKNLVFGWANVSTKDGRAILDRQGHMIDVDDLEDAAYNFVVKGRVSGDMHSSEPFGELVESVVVTQDKIDAGVFPQDKLGHWWVGFRVPDDRWESVARGERRMFSIEGSARLEPL